MKISDIIQYTVLILIFLAVAALFFGQALGQPILLGYVETGSMEPKLEPGDGFIAVPTALTGPPESGDVVVFNAEELQGGGLTTHRVVDQTEVGYITQGDANAFTDQDGPEPPVSESQIVAKALQFNGEIVVIPNLGSGVLAIQGMISGIIAVFVGVPGLGDLVNGELSPMALVVVGGLLIVVNLVADSLTGNRKRENHSRRRRGYYTSGMIFLIIAVVIIAPATASMVLGSGSSSLDIVSSESPNDNPLVVPEGETSTIEYQISNDGYIPMMTVLETDNQDISFSKSVVSLSPRSEETIGLTIQAPAETGAYSREVSQHRYLPFLPRSVILALHEIHPLLAVAAVDSVLLVGALSLGIVTIGFDSVRLRSASRNISFLEKLKRRFL
ncbi:signal peptidase I [Natrinema sp. H-ect4]|uniref:signal peptidase I n=1 Tax=Natrinema sp. H-ect4 TaxID=3242699 RepID=UPI0035A8EF58